jgi:hypothetical protein
VALLELSRELDPTLETINSNLEKALAARSAVVLAEKARPVKALPK